MMRKFKRFNLTGATEDYFLQVGEEAYISFSGVTSLPLRIATQDGTYYEMHIIPANPIKHPSWVDTRVRLFPNNNSYAEQIISAVIYRSQLGIASTYRTTDHAFYLGDVYIDATVYITNRTQYKAIRVHTDLYGTYRYGPQITLISSAWRDTSTPWTSLGTITWSSNIDPASGEILVRRLK